MIQGTIYTTKEVNRMCDILGYVMNERLSHLNNMCLTGVDTSDIEKELRLIKLELCEVNRILRTGSSDTNFVTRDKICSPV